MRLDINFPDSVAPDDAAQQVARIEAIMHDPTKYPILIAVPLAWSEEQFSAFSRLVVMLREEIDEGGHVETESDNGA